MYMLYAYVAFILSYLVSVAMSPLWAANISFTDDVF